MIELFDNRLEISNPGGLPKGLKEEDFGKRTLARNPLIAALLHRAGYIEKLGTGIPRIKQIMVEAGLPEPEFEFDKFFVITLKRRAASFMKKPLADLNISGTRSERIQHILDTIKAGKKSDVATIAKSFSVNVSTIRKDFLLLEEKGWLKGSGTTSNRVYELTEMAIARMEK